MHAELDFAECSSNMKLQKFIGCLQITQKLKSCEPFHPYYGKYPHLVPGKIYETNEIHTYPKNLTGNGFNKPG
jgi:hypothetical protein